MSDFSKTARAIVDDLLAHEPIDATWAGIHAYDADYPDVSADGFAELAHMAKDHLATLRRYDQNALEPQDWIDWKMLVSRFEVQLRELAELEPHKHNPSLYPNLAVEGIYSILARDYAPREKRLPAVISRLAKIPQVLEAGRTNLTRSPAIWTDIAMQETQGAAEFLRLIVGPLAQERGGDLARNLETALQSAADYGTFLKDHLAHKDGMSFAAGRDLFDFKLKHDHLVDLNADQLLDFGQRAVSSTQGQLNDVARRIDPTRSWGELVDAARKDMPAHDALLDEYQAGVDQSRQFVQDRQLASIPSGESLEVVETPAFMRPTIPYAAYMPAGGFEPRQKGLYYVTPVDERLPLEQRREQMLGHNRYGMLLTNVHEGYPGHHLQLVVASHVDSPVRKLLWNTVFCEGWALYCEQLVLEEGMTTDLRHRLFQLKDQLWRACRVVIDVGLHTSTMTFDQAVDMLVGVARLERPNAIGEVRRYTQSPTQPMSYLLGKQQILDLREREQQRLGPRFSMRAFHDRLLSYGTIPLALITPTFSAS
jgi:uncharacterized protein (DUF885 family)